LGVEGALVALAAAAAGAAAAGVEVATEAAEEEEDLTICIGYTHMNKVFLSCF
jgi:hypothetical protein